MMTDDTSPFSDDLDHGLRAAFGDPDGPSTDVGIASGIVGILETRHGFTSRLLLREDSCEDRVVRPTPPPETAPASRRYQVHGEIARGGVGVVLKGRDTDLGRDVAMKVLQKRHATNPALVRRFVEEAQIAGQLQHPGILPVYELGLNSAQEPFFTMKLVKGDTLADLLRRQPGRAAAERSQILSIFEDICQTIAYAHARGVIHRDLKPANVMVGAFGEVQVVDWGLAKVLGAGQDHDDTRTATVIATDRSGDPADRSVVGSVMGTPAYMAPEQARGETDRLDERVDVFALGAILSEILTGEPAFTGSSDAMMADAAAGRLDRAMARLAAVDTDTDLIDLARRCLAPRAADRPTTAREVAEAIRAHLASLEQRAHDARVEAIEAASRAEHERRARRLTLVVAACVLTVIVVGLGAFWAIEHNRTQREAAASERVNRALTDAGVLFGQAQAAPVGRTEHWSRLLDSEASIRTMLDVEVLDDATRSRAQAFLDELADGQRDRALIEQIEELVIYGATHDDADSWIWMEEELRHAYIDYGLDLDAGDLNAIAAQIRASPLAPQLTNGLELWIATVFHLSQWGRNPRPIPEMLDWVTMLYEADTDPYRSAIRRILYSQDPNLHVDDLNTLAESDAFDSALPRTKAWLASVYWRLGEYDLGVEVFKRALETSPADLMLNFDCAFHLVHSGRWNEATRYYHRALTVRPDSGGLWRSLGVALRELDDLPGALEAFDYSIQYQGDYPPTHLERGDTLRELEQLDAAIEAYDHAIALNNDFAIAHCRKGLALMSIDRLDEAIVALRRGHTLGIREAAWSHPSQEWLDECERRLNAADTNH